MRLSHDVRTREIGDGAGHTQYAVIAARGKAEPLRHAVEKRLAKDVWRRDLLEQSALRIGVRTDAWFPFVALALECPCRCHTRGHRGGAFARFGSVEVGIGHRRDIDPKVEPVHQRAGYAGEIVCSTIGGLGAGPRGFRKEAASTGVRGGDQQKTTGVAAMGIGTGDDDFPRFQRLAERLQHGAGKLGEFIQKQHAVVGERDLSWRGSTPATHDRGHGGGVMRLPEGATSGQPALPDQAGERVYHGGFQCLRGRKRRHQGRKPRGQHGLPRSGRADEQEVMAPRRSDLQRPLRPFLSLDIGQIAGGCRGGDFTGFGGGEGLLPGIMPDQFQKRAGGDHLRRLHPCCLAPAIPGADEAEVFGRSRHGRRQRAAYRLQSAVKRQLADEYRALHRIPRHDLERGQQGNGDGQVEMRTDLRQVGGGEVDGDAAAGQGDGHRRQRRAYTLPCLRHRLVGKPDDGEGGQPGGKGALHLHDPCLHPFESDGIGAGRHRETFLLVTARPCPEAVYKSLMLPARQAEKRWNGCAVSPASCSSDRRSRGSR